MKLTEKDKAIIKRFTEHCRKIEKNSINEPEQKISANRIFPDRYKLTSEEIEKRRIILTQLLKDAIIIVEKYINVFQNDQAHKDDEQLIKDLFIGLKNLNGRVKLINEGNWLTDVALRKLPGKRGGFGLLGTFDTGFNGFLLSDRSNWEKEIMDAVRKVEYYYANM